MTGDWGEVHAETSLIRQMTQSSVSIVDCLCFVNCLAL